VSGAEYAVSWTSPGQRALRKLPEKAAVAAVEFIYGSLAEGPHRAGKPLRHELAGLRTARRGEYRVIYRISEETRTIEIVTIEHRSDVYRPR